MSRKKLCSPMSIIADISGRQSRILVSQPRVYLQGVVEELLGFECFF